MMECIKPLYYGASISEKEKRKIEKLFKKDPIVLKSKWAYVILRPSKPFLMEYVSAKELNERLERLEAIYLLGVVKQSYEFKQFVLNTVFQVVQSGRTITQEHIIMELEGERHESH